MSKGFLSLESNLSLPTLQEFLRHVGTFICSNNCRENLEASFKGFPLDLTDIKVKKNFIEVEADTCMQFMFLPQCAEEQFHIFQFCNKGFNIFFTNHGNRFIC